MRIPPIPKSTSTWIASRERATYRCAVTIKEAAERLGVHPRTLQVQVRRGKLHAVKHGRDYWVEPREVERYRAASLGKRQPKS
jgi:excisionase family DNA binding protein